MKLEAEKRRKTEEEAERKRMAEERRKAAEEKDKVEEERRKMLETLKNAGRESAGRRPETVTEQPKNVMGNRESATEPNQNVSYVAGGGTFPQESATEHTTVGNIRSVEQQVSVAVDPFEPKQEEVKRYRTKFCAGGTRVQWPKLTQWRLERDFE